MSSVYIVQQQTRWDEAAGKTVPRFNFEPAKKYGRFVVLLPPTAQVGNPSVILAALRSGLKGFNESDYLLLVGNPIFMGWATAIAAERTGGRLKLLQWSWKQRGYSVIDSGTSIFDGS